ESGSKKVLRLMYKGITPERIRVVNRNFHEAGITTAWMTFLGHPGEGFTDARATLDLLGEEHPMVDQFIVGTFGLTQGSRIACRPEEFGIGSIYFTAGDVFRLFPQYSEHHQTSAATPSEGDEIDRQIDALSARYHLDHYPWAGAISTHHSFLYLRRYGQRVFNGHWPPAKGAKPAGRPASRVRPRFSLRAIRRAEERFMEHYLEQAMEPDPVTGQALLSYEHFQAALDRGVP
ncbi:hypothetical protein KJ865_06640, partial [Myxococcota bacterium]|nr:hypothetical protein [Myxococcota bacterium]